MEQISRPASIAGSTSGAPLHAGGGLATQSCLWARAIDLTAQGVPYVLATVVRAARRASCRAGDRAIVRADGVIEGWVGGSCAQPTVIAEALAALREGTPRLVAVTPHHDFPAREGMAVHPMTCVSGGEIEVFVEPVLPPPQLVVCGATPVATALVSIGAAAGFEVIVVDPDATTNRFPLATHVFSSVEGIVELARGASRERHVVAATHGQWDEAAIEGALRLDPDYIGLVASRTRYDATIADLIASGVTAERLKIVRSRPGLDLGAKTPAEVALGIVAEIVAHRRHVQIPDPERERESLPTALVEDPICGMMVSPETSIHWLEHDGTTWHYCNARCRRVHAGQLGVVLPTQATR